MSGKGSKPRPYSVDPKTFSSNWDNIFNKKSHDNCGTDDCCMTCDTAEKTVLVSKMSLAQPLQKSKQEYK